MSAGQAVSLNRGIPGAISKTMSGTYGFDSSNKSFALGLVRSFFAVETERQGHNVLALLRWEMKTSDHAGS